MGKSRATMRFWLRGRGLTFGILLVMALLAGACGDQAATSVAEGASEPGTGAGTDAGAGEAAVSEGGGGGGEGPVVKVGVIGPLTGGGSHLGTRTVNGAVLALEMANEGALEMASGDAGTDVQFEWVVADNETDVAEAVSQVRRLIQNEEVDAIIGGTLSDITLAMMEIAEDLETPMIIPGAISPAIPETIASEDYQYVFMSAPTANDRATADAQAVHDLVDPQRVFTVSQETAWGVPMQEAFQAQLEELNPDVEIESEFVDPGNTDFGAVVGNLRGFEPDLIYASLVGSEMFSFMEQLRSRGVEAPVYGASSDPASSLFIDELGAVAEGVMANLVWIPTEGNELIESFASAYEDKHGHTPADVEAQAYDAALMLISGARAAGGDDKAAIAEALLNVEIEGVRGPQQYETDDHTTRNLSFVVAQIQEEDHVVLWPPDMAEGEPQL